MCTLMPEDYIMSANGVDDRRVRDGVHFLPSSQAFIW